MKIVGREKDIKPSPEDCHNRAMVLIRQMDSMNPYPRLRGYIYKARTRKDYEKWRINQDNPRLW